MLALGTSVSYACGTFAYLQVLSLPVAVFCTVVVAALCVLVGEALVDPWTATHRGGPSRWIARGSPGEPHSTEVQARPRQGVP